MRGGCPYSAWRSCDRTGRRGADPRFRPGQGWRLRAADDREHAPPVTECVSRLELREEELARLRERNAHLEAELKTTEWHLTFPARGHSNCIRPPADGNERTDTVDPTPDRPASLRRSGVDGRLRWQDTPPACVPGMVWGTAPCRTCRLSAAPCLPPKCDRGLPRRLPGSSGTQFVNQ